MLTQFFAGDEFSAQLVYDSLSQHGVMYVLVFGGTVSGVLFGGGRLCFWRGDLGSFGRELRLNRLLNALFGEAQYLWIGRLLRIGPLFSGLVRTLF